MPETILHRAESRGSADHGWLKTHHTFSFADYFDPARMHFGALRVINDDWVEGGKGFGRHPHDNMEIITIPLEGDLEHKDSMGNTEVIRSGDVQVMSAGTGIMHSEYNKNRDKPVTLLQIWVLPNKKNVTPRYDQITVGDNIPKNELIQIVSPSPSDPGAWIHQDAWFFLGNFVKGFQTTYQNKNNEDGVYLFVIAGEILVNDQPLKERDGYGIRNFQQLNIKAISDVRVLLIEVPMY